MDNYRSWFEKGEKYFSGVQGKGGNPCKLSPVIQYNLIALAFESYAMAILDFYHTLPENHTFSDLLNAIQVLMPIDLSLRENILKHEEVQLICPLYEYHRRDPTLEEVNEFKLLISQFTGIVRDVIYNTIIEEMV